MVMLSYNAPIQGDLLLSEDNASINIQSRILQKVQTVYFHGS